MKRLIGIIALLLICTSCGTNSIGDMTIVDMIELQSGEEVTVSVEYRIIGSKDEPVKYAVMTGTGTTVWEAVGDIEQSETTQLYLDNCMVINLVGYSSDSIERLLTELDTTGEVHPKANITATATALLATGSPTEKSVYKDMEEIFAVNGGLLGNRFTLKDSIIAIKDEKIPNMIPIIEEEKLADIKLWNGDSETVIATTDILQLPIADVIDGQWRIYLEQAQQEVIMESLFMVNNIVLQDDKKVLQMEIMPTYTVVSGKDSDATRQELYSQLQTAVEESIEEIVKGKKLDIYGVTAAINIYGLTEKSYDNIDYNIIVKNFFIGE